MGCLDGLLRWKSIYTGKLIYQEYGIYGRYFKKTYEFVNQRKICHPSFLTIFKFCFIFRNRRDLLFSSLFFFRVFIMHYFWFNADRESVAFMRRTIVSLHIINSLSSSVISLLSLPSPTPCR